MGRMLGAWCVGVVAIVSAMAEAAPRFRVETDASQRSWFVGPDGEKFLSLGVNTIKGRAWNPKEGSQFYDAVNTAFGGDRAKWAKSALDILRSGGFNTIASWSDPDLTAPDLVVTPILYVQGTEPERVLAPLREDFEAFVRVTAKAELDRYAGPDRFLGVFLDNEIAWWGKSGWDVIPTYTLLERALEWKADSFERVAAIKFLASRHATAEAMGKAYGRPVANWDEVTGAYMQRCLNKEVLADRDAFTQMIADRFYEVSTRVVREILPETLILGTRFSGDAPDSVIKACGKTCDVISVNIYSPDPQSTKALLTRYSVLGQRPLMATEFSWRSAENQSGNPNTRGAGQVVPTQQDRADRYRAFVTDLFQYPMVIGAHWFEWADQSPQGRFDGENSNYGIVDIKHGRYETLLKTMAEVNPTLASLHAQSTRPLPTELPERKRVTYTAGQHPGRAPTMSIIKEPIVGPELWNAQDASLSLDTATGQWVVTYDCGGSYGVGMSCYGPRSQELEVGPWRSSDLDGYDFIVVDAEVPEGLQINVLVNEAGSDQPGSSSFDATAGDDGESFISPPVIAEAGRKQYRIPIADLLGNPFWGNQAGDRRVDMRAVLTVGVQFQGRPQQGKVVIHDLRLER